MPPQGSPFGTGSANQLTPEFKRLADSRVTSPSWARGDSSSRTRDSWSWLNKRRKITPILGTYHVEYGS
ncbi:hypothetical protein B0H10DRAFT_2142856 [Mycena sp. CBHHK59/15]|nr:hypothetical protein B0H10DRAFT_2142856 [Mycena sp. CBHHK59/15]